MATKIQKVQNQPNFPQIENQISEFWKKNNIFNKSVEQRDINNSYSFVDGPPFVTGMPHYGSLLPSIAKDVIPRFWTMKGKRVRRVWGWDCHGLPIEEKVNKKFGIKSSVQLEAEMGVEKYVQECRKWVEQASSDWKWYIEKIGRWVDMDNAYYTMNISYMESVIWAFKQMHEKGFIYKGKRTSLYSTDTSTPVSGFEVAMDQDNYKEVEDLSIFTKFKLSDTNKVLEQYKTQNIYLVAWTTTPWTIPSNFGLAVNPKENYCLVLFEGEYLIIAKARLAYTFQTNEENIGEEKGKLVQVLNEFKGTQLEGLSYTPIYDFFLSTKTPNDYKVYLYDGVTIEDGTGILHLAPAFGEEDFALGKQYGLSDTQDIDEAGKLIVGEWKGVYLRDASPLIAEDLQKKGNLLRSLSFKHRLPFYRGDNPLIYVSQESYFVNIQKIKNEMSKLNENINWIPNHIKEGRFAHTIETSPDWAISRNRYWATIMPIWKSEDGDELVIGSLEEMSQYTDQITKKEIDGKIQYYFITDTESYYSSEGAVEFQGDSPDSVLMDLHRDICDKIILTKENKKYYRIPEVLDCWMDSGSVPFAEHHYPFENKDSFEKAFPADFIVEYVGQVRAWFNVLLRVSTMLFQKEAFTNVICTGVLAGNDGRKMSKSFGNYPDPKEVLEKIGGEAVRLYLMGSPIMVGGDMNWSDEVLNDYTKNLLIPLWNTYKYLTIYAELHNWNPKDSIYSSKNVLDKWIESYMNKTTLEYSKALESYNIPESVRLIQPCIENISTWWIRRSRDRFVTGDLDALQTLYCVFVQFIKTFAPQMPFLTEEMYLNLVVNTQLSEAKESVHLEYYPIVESKSINEELLNQMKVVRDICSLGLKVRDEKKLKIRQPLNKVIINAIDKNYVVTDKGLLEIVKDELNVKGLEFVNTLVESNSSATDGNLTVVLDTNLTQELKDEGLLNELKRALQNLRKTSGLKMGEMINIFISTENNEIKNVINKYAEELAKSISAIKVELSENIFKENQVKIGEVIIDVELIK